MSSNQIAGGDKFGSLLIARLPSTVTEEKEEDPIGRIVAINHRCMSMTSNTLRKKHLESSPHAICAPFVTTSVSQTVCNPCHTQLAQSLKIRSSGLQGKFGMGRLNSAANKMKPVVNFCIGEALTAVDLLPMRTSVRKSHVHKCPRTFTAVPEKKIQSISK